MFQSSPGPGAYDARDVSKPEAVNSPGFLSSAKRDDRHAQKFFTRNFVSKMLLNRKYPQKLKCIMELKSDISCALIHQQTSST